MASRFLRQSLLAASVITIGTNILGRVFGYVREAAVAGCFGTGADFDTFILAFTVPELVTFVVFAALPMALIPLVRMREAKGTADHSSLFWCGLVLFGSFFAALSLCAYLFKDSLLLWLAPNLLGNQLAIGRRLASVLAWFIFFRGVEAYLRSWLFAKKHFVVPLLSAILINVVILAALYIFYGRLGIETLAYGWLAGSIVSFVANGVIALVVVRPGGLGNWRSVPAGTLIKSTMAVALIECIALAYPVVDRYLAARLLGEGQIAALRYATFLIHIPTGMFAVAYSHAVFPWITDFSVAEETERSRSLYRRSVSLLIFVMGLIAVGVLVFPADIVRLAFQRGAFDQESLRLTAGPLRWYAAGVVFYSVYMFQIRFYYARAARLRLGLILAGMLLVKVACSLLLVGSMQHNGLALATAITWLAGFVAMSRDLRLSLRMSVSDSLFPVLPKILLGLAVVAGFWVAVAWLWPSESSHSLGALLTRLAVIGASGTAVYAALAHHLGVPELREVIERIREALSGGKPTASCGA